MSIDLGIDNKDIKKEKDKHKENNNIYIAPKTGID